jgi:hypothetical protein
MKMAPDIKDHLSFLRSELWQQIQTAGRREGRRGWRRWLVNDFARAPLQQATEEDLAGLHVHVCALAQAWGADDWTLALEPLSREGLIEVQTKLRTGLQAFLAGRPWEVDRRTVRLVVGLAPAAPKRWATTYRSRIDSIRAPSVLRSVDAEPLPLDRRFLGRAAEEIASALPGQLRYCHWCAEFFIRTGRRDLYCSEPCAQRDRNNRRVPRARREIPPYIDRLIRVEGMTSKRHKP